MKIKNYTKYAPRHIIRGLIFPSRIWNTINSTMAPAAMAGVLALEHDNDSIYFNAGYKSYKITRLAGEEPWFEWTECSRYLMRKVKISIKVLKWVVSVFIEASKIKGNVIQRWNLRDHFEEFYGTLKFNKNGRYVSFIAIQGEKRSIIIIPEFSDKVGWSNIAHKIAKLVHEPSNRTANLRVKERNTHMSYKEAVRSSRWTVDTKEERAVQTTMVRKSELLNRCLVGRFQNLWGENPTLNDVRRWACNTWKATAGINVFTMNDNLFLFELPTKSAAEHVMTGNWSWRKKEVFLEWWSPTTGCWLEGLERNWVWIRAMGLPLNLWSQKVFERESVWWPYRDGGRN